MYYPSLQYHIGCVKQPTIKLWDQYFSYRMCSCLSQGIKFLHLFDNMLVGCILDVLHVISNQPRASRSVSLSINCRPVDSFIFCSICLWLYSPCGPWTLFQFLNLYTVGTIPCTGDQPIARPLPTHRTSQTQNKCTQTSMPRVGFEPTIPVFERANTVHALHCGHCDRLHIPFTETKYCERCT
jgi:hypothetical protein